MTYGVMLPVCTRVYGVATSCHMVEQQCSIVPTWIWSNRGCIKYCCTLCTWTAVDIHHDVCTIVHATIHSSCCIYLRIGLKATKMWKKTAITIHMRRVELLHRIVSLPSIAVQNQ